MAHLTFITGPARSGKSQRALDLATAWGGHAVFVATGRMDSNDSEMLERMAQHRLSRPAAWRTLEAPDDVCGALAEMDPAPAGALIDCMTLWLGGRLKLPDAEILAAWEFTLAGLKAAPWPAIIVGNEVGWSPAPENVVTRRFRDLAGSMAQRTAAAADEAWLMIAGCPLKFR